MRRGVRIRISIESDVTPRSSRYGTCRLAGRVSVITRPNQFPLVHLCPRLSDSFGGNDPPQIRLEFSSPLCIRLDAAMGKAMIARALVSFNTQSHIAVKYIDHLQESLRCVINSNTHNEIICSNARWSRTSIAIVNKIPNVHETMYISTFLPEIPDH